MHLRKRKLLDHVAGEFLTECSFGDLVFFLVQSRSGGVHGGTDNEVTLVGDFVRSVSLRFCARTETNAGDTITTLDGNAVGREGPLVGQRTAFALGLGFSVRRAETLGAVHGVVRIDQTLNVSSVGLVDPGREEALGLVDFAGP